MKLNDLERILSVPRCVEVPRRWDYYEKKLDIKLPSDYKQFIDKYGVGWIGDFLLVLDPSSHIERYNLVNESVELLNNYQSSKESFPQYYKHTIFNGVDGLFPCAITDNADVVYWQYINGVAKNIVVYNARGGKYFSIESTLIDFVYNVLTKGFVCDRFPEDFPAENIEFVVDEE